MANLNISILLSLLSGGKVGSKLLSSPKAELNASTRTRSRDAWASRYLGVALRLLRRSSRVKCSVPGVREFGPGSLELVWATLEHSLLLLVLPFSP